MTNWTTVTGSSSGDTGSTNWTTVTGSSSGATGSTGALGSNSMITNPGTITITSPSTGFSSTNTFVVGGGGGGGAGTTGQYYTSSGWSSPNTTITLGKGGKPVLSTEKNEIDLDELADFVKIMRERMLILVPDFEKHEKYAALKKAYDHYKMIEALLQEDKKDDK